jgi:hypothetical protein
MNSALNIVGLALNNGLFQWHGNIMHGQSVGRVTELWDSWNKPCGAVTKQNRGLYFIFIFI